MLACFNQTLMKSVLQVWVGAQTQTTWMLLLEGEGGRETIRRPVQSIPRDCWRKHAAEPGMHIITTFHSTPQMG